MIGAFISWYVTLVLDSGEATAQVGCNPVAFAETPIRGAAAAKAEPGKAFDVDGNWGADYHLISYSDGFFSSKFFDEPSRKDVVLRVAEGDFESALRAFWKELESQMRARCDGLDENESFNIVKRLAEFN